MTFNFLKNKKEWQAYRTKFEFHNNDDFKRVLLLSQTKFVLEFLNFAKTIGLNNDANYYVNAKNHCLIVELDKSNLLPKQNVHVKLIVKNADGAYGVKFDEYLNCLSKTYRIEKSNDAINALYDMH